MFSSGKPRARSVGLFLMTAATTRFIASTLAALIMIPIAVSAATEPEISPFPFLIGVALGASGPS
jgi:di/tricarboxylate transporter